MILFILFCLPSTSEKNSLDREKNVEKNVFIQVYLKKKMCLFSFMFDHHSMQ